MTTPIKTSVIHPTDIDQTRPRKGLPKCNKFCITPKRKPHICHFIKSADWNYVQNIVTLEVLETPAFSTFDWLSNINDYRKAMQKSVFGDLEQDNLLLQMFDENDKVVGQVRLKGMDLKDHSCKLHKEDDGAVVHTAVISYESIEVLRSVPDNEEEQMQHPSDSWAMEQFDLPPTMWDVKKTKEFLKYDHDII